jgi:hypothetical protein
MQVLTQSGTDARARMTHIKPASIKAPMLGLLVRAGIFLVLHFLLKQLPCRSGFMVINHLKARFIYALQHQW